MSNLTLLNNFHSKYQEAETIDRSVLQHREHIPGSDHPDTITSLNNLGIDLRVQGKYEEAAGLLQRAFL